MDTVTLSIEQKRIADERAAEAGLADHVRVHLCDYRKLPASFEGKFDALVSCEMVEVSQHIVRIDVSDAHLTVSSRL